MAKNEQKKLTKKENYYFLIHKWSFEQVNRTEKMISKKRPLDFVAKNESH
jgi:hypothetical protein